MIGCKATLAGHCVSISPFRAFMVLGLWGAALLMLDRIRMEVRADE